MKSIRAVKRTKLARRILRAPVILIAVILSAVLGLSSCGGGESVNSDGSKMMVMPPVGGGSGNSESDSFYGAISGQLSPTGTNSCGFAAGIATGYTSQAAAKNAAISQCRQAGGTKCEALVLEYGSAYQGANSCGALAYGYRTGEGCLIRFGRNATREIAKAEAIASCERTAFARNNGLDCAHSVVSNCSTFGPATSYSRSVTGSGSSNTNVRTRPWIAFSIQEQFQGCMEKAWAIREGSSKQAAEAAALAACDRNSSHHSSCLSSEVISTTSCLAYAEGDRCGGGWSTGSTLASARNSALAGCRTETGNCRVQTSGCASN